LRRCPYLECRFWPNVDIHIWAKFWSTCASRPGEGVGVRPMFPNRTWSEHVQCTNDGSELHFEHIFSYRPILNLQQRLRLALEARGNEALCVALQEQLFHNRRFPTFNPLNTVELGRLSRSIIWMANHYAMFDGGNPFNVKCPIAGLKFDAPIWPQLLNHVLQLRHTPLGEEESANDLRRAELALVDGPLARLEDPPSGEATPSL